MMELNTTTNEAVAYTRAGDIFHYRWAARRCLKLIHPTSHLESIYIEGSSAKEKAGEYVIDVSEYYTTNTSSRRIEYYQLKHSTKNASGLGTPFKLNHLEKTLAGFADRFRQHKTQNSLDGVGFTILTNRLIDEPVKRKVSAVIKGEKVDGRFLATVTKYTNLKGDDLSHFLRRLNLQDSEGDYLVQEQELREEMSRLQPGTIDSAQVASIVELVQKRVLPDVSGKIVAEDVLRPFGVTSEKHLFPAPPKFESVKKLTIREVYRTILNDIKAATHPVIVHAEGGVGKSVFSQYLLHALPEKSLGIAYDCFGAGTYRSRSQPRHRHRDALVQIVNELATLGLCERMLVADTTLETDIMRDFLSRIAASVDNLKKAHDQAELFILIDAADNAEMAAQEFADACFANELFRESFPEGCNIVVLCRPGRIELLKPPTFIQCFELPSFSEAETLENLIKWFPNATENEAKEFHRLTYGNPRVQMNAIDAAGNSISDLLKYLGPHGITVQQQIESQLKAAVQNIKDNLPEIFQKNIRCEICTKTRSCDK